MRSISLCSKTPTRNFAMKPGTAISCLDIKKNADPVVVRDRGEYDEFINDLCEPLTSLAQLQKMPIEDATIKDMKRYLKLTRRLEIKEKNADTAQ